MRKIEEKYIENLKSGKQIRIKYNKLNHDWCEDDSGWMEELWCYDSLLDLFRCYYPISTYEKNFYTTHSENETRSFLRESIIDSDNEYDNATVTDIIVENCNIPVSSLSIREAAMEKIKNMSDEELKLRILL